MWWAHCNLTSPATARKGQPCQFLDAGIAAHQSQPLACRCTAHQLAQQLGTFVTVRQLREQSMHVLLDPGVSAVGLTCHNAHADDK